MTLPEVLLWQHLRAGKTGLKFRRQHPVGPYVVDFCSVSAHVVVEIDCEVHSRGDRPDRDATRDDFLRQNGFRVIHLPATVVLRDMESAITEIVALAASPLHRPTDGPPPRSGEDLSGMHS